MFSKYILLVLLAIPLFIASYCINRGQFLLLIGLISISAIAYFYAIFKQSFTWKEILIGGIILRGMLLFNVPNLSDDYFRFVWDGQMIVQGENPYLILPKEHIKKAGVEPNIVFLCKEMNSKQYYTVYPPFNQFTFAVAAFLGGKSVYMNIFWMKVLILLSEIGILIVLFKLLRALKMSEHLASIYAFNPLVILELVGNVHFEGMMLFFMLLSLLLIIKNKLVLAGIIMALAINTKLMPLMLLPLFIGFLRWRRSVLFYSVTGISILAMFAPFISMELIQNFGSSIDLYFQNFEFNASFYYLFRWIGFELTGHNIIKDIGYILPLIVLSLITYKSLTSKKGDLRTLISNMSTILFVYYLFASIVHPWYVINLVVLAVFSKHYWVLVWSITVFLSYFAYSNYIYTNELTKHSSSLYFLLVGVEYVLVLFALIFFLRKKYINY